MPTVTSCLKKCFCFAFLLDPFPSGSKTACNAVRQMTGDFVCGFRKELQRRLQLFSNCRKAEKQRDMPMQRLLIHCTEDSLKSLLTPHCDSSVKPCVLLLHLSFKSWVDNQYLLHPAWSYMWWLQHWADLWSWCHGDGDSRQTLDQAT